MCQDINQFFSFYNGRGSKIRTYDPLVPNQMRYQAALCPDSVIRSVFTTFNKKKEEINDADLCPKGVQKDNGFLPYICLGHPNLCLGSAMEPDAKCRTCHSFFF